MVATPPAGSNIYARTACVTGTFAWMGRKVSERDRWQQIEMPEPLEYRQMWIECRGWVAPMLGRVPSRNKTKRELLGVRLKARQWAWHKGTLMGMKRVCKIVAVLCSERPSDWMVGHRNQAGKTLPSSTMRPTCRSGCKTTSLWSCCSSRTDVSRLTTT
jgi:hypothetical protein